ncbi:MAG: glycoside hydrolase family 78 protein [Bacteroidales bacterium]|jgi:alpha-L-rhamnosidase|nr:glycoside hydrolase family 78 protein [Bacteroidales bacterium]
MNKYIFLLAAISGMALAGCDRPTVSVSGLRCEHLTSPLGIDVAVPRFSWVVDDRTFTRGQQQTAYQVLVASAEAKLHEGAADLWDSGIVSSSESHLVEYRGVPLKSGANCFWTVRVYDRNGKASRWSRPSRFSTGLFDASDWRGEWIRHPSASSEKHIWFRKMLTLKGAPAEAMAYIAVNGYHELYVNGHKVGNDVLAPTLTRIDRRITYLTRDITPLLHSGDNIIALWYAPGWTRSAYFSRHTNQAALFQLYGRTKNGAAIELHSDTTWRTAESYSSNCGGYDFMNMGGETVDGTRYTAQWNTAGYDDSHWPFAAATSPLRNGEPLLSAQMTDPTRIVETVHAQSITDTVPGVYRVDMGKNFTGFLNVRFHGLSRGDTVMIRISENPLAKYGDIDIEPSARIGVNAVEEHRQRHYYIARGADGEEFCNRFNFFCGRYVHFSGLKQAPRIADIKGYALTSAAPRTGSFTCSEPLFNSIYEIDRYTYEMCNTEGVTADCPNRERLGYGPEGAYLTAWGAGMTGFASTAYYRKNIRDWGDVQRHDGYIANIAPQVWNSAYGGSLNGAAILNLAWENWLTSGDDSMLPAALTAGCRWLDFLSHYVSDDMLTPYATHGYFLGEWLRPGPVKEYGGTDEALFFNNCVYAMTLDFCMKIAKTLGETAIETACREKLDALRTKLHRTYFHPATGSYLTGDQVRTAFALYAGIPPDSLKNAVIEHLHRDMTGEHPYFNIGSFTRYPYFKTLLANRQFTDVVCDILLRKEYPGYGYFVANGCNTWPEAWEIVHPNSSLVHTSYAGISGWFIKALAGIEPDAAGYKTVSISPRIPAKLQFVRATLLSPYGEIKSGWEKTADGLRVDITVPVGVSARIRLPASPPRISENSLPLDATEGITSVSESGDSAIIIAESGCYSFMVH